MKKALLKKIVDSAAIGVLAIGLLVAPAIMPSEASAETGNVTPDSSVETGTVKKVTVTFTGDSKTTKGFTWYTTKASGASDLQIVEKTGEKPDFSKAKKFTGTSYYSHNAPEEVVHKAEATGLKPDTEYFYRVGDEKLGLWSEGTAKTAPESGAFTFLELTDPQAKTEEEGQLAAHTFNVAKDTVKDFDFMSVTGDFVDEGTTEIEWDWLIENSKDVWSNTTIAPTAGNHEDGNFAFIDHFNLKPAATSTDTETGAYYSYDYSNTHFVVLNTNEDSEEYQDFTPAQVNWMTEDIKAAKANGARWTVVFIHKGPYTTANHATDDDIMDENGVRNKIAPLIGKLGVDLVIQGHDHIFARSLPINGDNEATEPTIVKESLNGETIEYAVDPEGAIYFINNTAGPKTYAKNPDPSLGDAYFDKFAVAIENHSAKYGGETGETHDQPRPARGAIQNFSSIKVEENRLTVVTYEIDSFDQDNKDPYIIDQFGIQKKDVTAPAKPTVNAVSDVDQAVKGTAEPGSKVTVKAGDKVLGSAAAGDNGEFNVAISKQQAGTKLSVYAEDASGNKSEAVTVTVADKTAPAKPKVDKVSAGAKKITGTAEAGANVTVLDEDRVLGSATVDKDGKFSVAVDAQQAGHTLTVYAEDKSGNKSEATEVKVEKAAKEDQNDQNIVSGDNDQNGSNDQNTSNGDSENALPDTATSMFSEVLIGALLALAGVVSLIVWKRKKSVNHQS